MATTIELIHDLLEQYGLDLSDPNLVDTPKRVSRVLDEFTGFGIDFDVEYDKLAKSVFPHKGDNMVIAVGIMAWSCCPHHLLPIKLNVSIAYLPHGYVIGVSKLARFAKLCARKLQLQEDYTRNLGMTLQKWLHTDDVAVLVKGRHTCMEMRGVETEAEIITSEVLGAFRKEPSVRQEFLQLIHK